MDRNANEQTDADIEIAGSDSGHPSRHAAWLRVLLAPVLDLARPRSGAACLAAASRPALVTILALSLVGYAAVLIGLMLWGNTVRCIWVLPPAPAVAPATTTPATAPTTTPATMPASQRRRTPERWERSVGDVWRVWRTRGWFGPAELTLALVVGLGIPALLFLAWLNLPLVHSTGAAWDSYKRSFRAGAAVLWPLAALTLVCGGLFIVKLHAAYRAGQFWGGGDRIQPGVFLFAGIGVSLGLLALYVRRAIRSIAPAASALPLPPRCEGCGYDLTHQPESGRCPECGLGLDASLVEHTSRPGSDWMRGRSPARWLTTWRAVVFKPRAFYRRLKLRTPDPTEAGFAAWNYVLLVCAAMMWAWCTLGQFLVRNVVPTAAAVLCGTFLCWLGHRVLAAFVVSSWMLRKGLPDLRWAAKTMVYESAFLWVFCAFWGVMFTSFIWFENWISHLLGRGPWTADAEGFALLAGTAILTAAWLVRYEIAYRTIRWSNY